MAIWDDDQVVDSQSNPKMIWDNDEVVGDVPAPKKNPIDLLPGEKNPDLKFASEPSPEPMYKQAEGVGEAALSTATAIPASIVGQLYGAGKSLFGGNYGTQKGIEQGADAAQALTNKLTYSPRTRSGQQYTQEIGNLFDASRLAGMPMEGQFLGRAPEIPRAVNEARGISSELATNAGQATKQAARTGAMKILPTLDPETQQIAREAHSMGFRFTPDQVLPGGYKKMAGETMAKISGSNKGNRDLFNQKLVDLVGGEGKNLTRSVYEKAYNKWGGTIGDIAERNPLPIDDQLVSQLRENAEGQLPGEQGVINSYIDMIQKGAKDGVLPGGVFRKLNTAIGKRARETTNGDLKHALNNLQEDLLDARSQYMSPEDQALYNQARRHYATLKQLEGLVAKSPSGDINPGALLNQITNTKSGKSLVARGASGELGRLADIGNLFLKEQPSSGTAERSLMNSAIAKGALGGGGVLAASMNLPLTAAGVAGTYGLANLYGRYGPAITDLMIDKPPR